MRRTSGSWRSVARSALSKEGVCVPTSRWLMSDCLRVWTTSIGSSTLTMWSAWVRLIESMIAARVVDLPEPVGPPTRTRPFFIVESSFTTGGSPRFSISGISFFTSRKTPAIPVCCEKT